MMKAMGRKIAVQRMSDGRACASVNTTRLKSLVGNDAGRPIGRRGVDAVGIQIRLGAGNEEGASLMQDIKAHEVDVAAIHDIDGARFGKQMRQSRVSLASASVDRRTGSRKPMW